MKPSNKASRNAWASLTILGIAAAVANIPSAIMNSNDLKSWWGFILCIAIAVSFCKKFLFYQKLVNRGIEFGRK